jgi:hypothetical protein
MWKKIVALWTLFHASPRTKQQVELTLRRLGVSLFLSVSPGGEKTWVMIQHPTQINMKTWSLRSQVCPERDAIEMAHQKSRKSAGRK